jgi:predicted amidophosphoribosyltransferase
MLHRIGDYEREFGENAPLSVARTCSVCGVKLATNASYCHDCGTIIES